jgi:hypothetical protein
MADIVASVPELTKNFVHRWKRFNHRFSELGFARRTRAKASAIAIGFFNRFHDTGKRVT